MAVDYTDKATVENYLALLINSSLNSYVTLLIKAVGKFIDKECHRTFQPATTDTDKIYDGNDDQILEIHDYTELSKVTVDGSELDLTTVLKYPANLIDEPYTKIRLQQTYNSSNNSRLTSRTYSRFTKGEQNVKVTGKFQYASEVPEPIKIVATMLVGGIIKKAVGDKDVKEVTSESIGGDYSVSYAKITEMADAIGAKDLMAPYIREWSNKKVKTGFVEVS